MTLSHKTEMKVITCNLEISNSMVSHNLSLMHSPLLRILILHIADLRKRNALPLIIEKRRLCGSLEMFQTIMDKRKKEQERILLELNKPTPEEI